MLQLISLLVNAANRSFVLLGGGGGGVIICKMSEVTHVPIVWRHIWVKWSLFTNCINLELVVFYRPSLDQINESQSK